MLLTHLIFVVLLSYFVIISNKIPFLFGRLFGPMSFGLFLCRLRNDQEEVEEEMEGISFKKRLFSEELISHSIKTCGKTLRRRRK